MPLDTNLNVTPYFDDFYADNGGEVKNYHRVLFRPGVAVQARELTQLQTILQNQIERFGDNIYKTGTIIRGCSLTVDIRYDYIKILDSQNDGQPVSLPSYANTLLIQESANLQSLVVNYKTGFESQDPDLNTLYIKYINTGTSGEKAYANAQTIKVFSRQRTIEDVSVVTAGSLYSNSDTITFSGGGGSGATAVLTTDATGQITDVSVQSKGTGYTSTPNVSITTSTGSGGALTAKNYISELTVASVVNSVGTGAAVKTSDGIIYQKGFFISVDAQEEVLEKYSFIANNKVVGFRTIEAVVNSNADSTLLDLATGTPNFAAPGANRLKLTPTLTVLSKPDAEANTEFLSLLEFENGNVVKDRTNTQFNSINTELSRRTFEESGDYVIKPFQLNTEDITGNTTHFNVVVGSGTAYVRGQRIETLNSIRVAARKGTDFSNTNNQTINTKFGSYIMVKELLGLFEIKEGTSINLRNTAATDVTDNSGGTPSAPGSVIGTAKVRSIEYSSGKIGTPDAQYKVYVFDVRMSGGYAFKDTRSLSIGSTAVADVVLTNGSATIKDVENDILVFNSGTFAVREFNQEQFIFRTSTNSTFTTGGSVTISFSGGNTLPYGVGTLTDADADDFIVIPSATAYHSSNGAGTVATTSGQTNVTGTSTTFLSTYEVGDYIKIGTNSPIRVASISNNTLLTLASAAGFSATSNGHYMAYPANVPVDFTRTGKSITVNSTTSLTVDLGAAINSTTAFTVYHDLENFEPGVRVKSLNNPVYVKLSTSKLSGSTTGPWCLGIPDVLSIEGVYVGTGNTYSDATTNYAADFELDSGQKDNYYGLAYISKAPGSTIDLTSSNCLLVKVKAFTHSSGKYLSTESYPVDDSTTPLPDNKIRTESIPVYVSRTSGQALSLRDSIDFRPIVANTAVLSSTTGGASIDPSTTETLVAGEKFFPSPSRSFECDIQSYLGRVDRIVVGEDGRMRVVEGVPSNNPLPPQRERTSMDLGIIKITPYPSLSAKASSVAKRPDLKNTISLLQTQRYTMKDIGELENRLQKLEYYTLLNTLEANAATTSIPSESNSSIAVFKNGFFVDSFDNYNISDLNDGEYKALVDTNTSRLIPQQEIYPINLKYNSTSSSGVTKIGDLVMLPYTEKELIKQNIANKERTLVEQNWSFKGKMIVTPKVDNFFDSEVKATTVVDINIADPLASLVDAQNEINSKVTAATKLLGTATSYANTSSSTRVNYSTTDASGRYIVDGYNELTRTNWTRNVRQTYQDSRVNISTPPVVSSTQEVNNLLTSVHINPYIRGQRVAIYCSGLRPGAQHYVYFDKEDLTSASEPAKVSNFSNMSLSDFSPLYNKGSSPGLFANNTGEIAVIVTLPSDTFTTGEKEFLLMDVSSLASELSATSKATGKFSSFTTSGTAQNLTFSTKTFDTTGSGFNTQTFSDIRTVNTSTSGVSFSYSNTVTRITEIPVPQSTDPLSQTFFVQRQQGADYIYLSSIDVYFKQKDSSKGVTLMVREVSDSGYPTSIVLPFSRVYKRSSDINVSSNGTTATKFTFDSPVCVRADKDYAIILAPDGNSPEYRIWTAETGVPDVANTSLISNQSWGLGTMFFSVSDKVFTAVQNEDIKFTVNRADFSGSSGTLVLNNGDYEFLTVNAVSGSFTPGEDVAQMTNTYIDTSLTTNNQSYVITTNNSLTSILSANDRVLFVFGSNASLGTANVKVTGTSVTNSTASTTDFTTTYANGDFIMIGDEVRLITNVASATALSVDAPFNATISDSTHYSVDPDFDVLRVVSANSTSFTVNRPPLLSVSNSTSNSVSLQKVVGGTLSSYNANKGKLFIEDSNSSNSNFLVRTSNSTYYGYIVGDRSDALAKVISIDNVNGTVLTPFISTLNIPGTAVSLSGTFTKAAGGTSSSTLNLGSRNPVGFNDSAVIKSRSNEISGTSVNKSFSTTLTLTSNYTDTSPVVDVNPASVLLQKNIINNLSTNENTRYGNAQCKYVSKSLELAEDLDAEDIKVYIKAYRPSTTDVKIYAKVLNQADSDSFEDKDWSELEMVTSSSLFSSSLNPSDLREYEFTFKRTPTATVLAGKVQSNSACTTVVGSGTSFSSDLTANDIVKIVYTSSTTDYDIIPVSSVANNTHLVLSTAPSSNTIGCSIEKVTGKKEAFKYSKNSSIVRYFDISRAAHDSYKYFAIKVVLKAENSYLVPELDDIRVIATSV